MQFSVKNERALVLVVDMIEELSHQLEMLLMYNRTPDLIKDMDRAFVAVFVEIITFAFLHCRLLAKTAFSLVSDPSI